LACQKSIFKFLSISVEIFHKFFDRILCVGVLIHSSIAEIDWFLKQAYSTSKDEGKPAISATHPFMYTAQSPSRKPGTNWVKHEPTLHLPEG
jgi:cyclopropane fatty-acyl-phospholipid synthase-like methyltransferase